MSLLLTSNTPKNLNSGYSQQGINQSYSYQNHLNDTFKISKNSEIAVQSVKINRSGNIDLNEANSIYSFYFGEEITGDQTEKQDQVLSIPWCTSFASTQDSRYFGTGNDEISVDMNTIPRFNDNSVGIARMMKASLNRALWHPNLMLNASTGVNPGANVEPLRNGSGLDWLGWKLQVTNTDESKNASHISASWMGAGYNGKVDGDDYAYNTNTRVLTAPVGNDQPCVGIKYPLSLANGSFEFKGFDQTSNARFGLSRALDFDEPTYYDGGGYPFFDFVVEIDDGTTGGTPGDISVLYAGSDGSRTELEMIEIDYGTVVNAAASNIQKIYFNIKNERVTIKVEDDKAAVTVLCDGTSATSGSNVKPVSMTCRYLYPKIDMEPGKTVTINQFYGVDVANHTYFGFNEVNGQEIPTYTDYWAHKNFLTHRNINQIRTMDLDFTKNITKLNQLGLNLNGQCDYKVQFFFGPDSNYWNTKNCNSQFLMGFPNRSLVNVANTTAVASPFTLTYQSDESPEMKSSNSLFVRLKNMTFNSVNLAKGSNSKILYHLPTFSNTGTRAGALFFEPNERVYLKLNNTEDLFLSTIEIDLCYADETLATDLVGKTCVILHVRDA